MVNNPPELEEFIRNQENKFLRDYIELLQERIVEQDNEITELKDDIATIAKEDRDIDASMDAIISELDEININYHRPGFFERLFG